MGTQTSQVLGARVSTPYILAQSAVPVCLAPNGTVATNGIVTLGTALPTTYSGGIWLRLPANAIVGGAAGLYWVVMSSTTVGQVYTNFADPATEFIPSIPSGALVAAVGSNAAYTQTTGADITLVNATLAGGSLGLNGTLETKLFESHPSNANNKTFRNKLGGTTFLAIAATTSLTSSTLGFATNRGVANAQTTGAQTASSFGINTIPALYLGVDTSAAVASTITGQLAVATDFIVFERFCMNVMPS